MWEPLARLASCGQGCEMAAVIVGRETAREENAFVFDARLFFEIPGILAAVPQEMGGLLGRPAHFFSGGQALRESFEIGIALQLRIGSKGAKM